MVAHPLIAFVLMLTAPLIAAAELDTEIDRLKADVAELASDLYELEEAFLHPADTQVAVFLTLARSDALTLDSIELSVNDTPVASHFYSERELRSLQQGGVQQLFIGNVPVGEHRLKAVLTARTANDRYVRREVAHRFQKEPGEFRIQLSVDARAPEYEPQIGFAEWK